MTSAENLLIQMTGRLGVRQLVLVQDLTKAIESVNSLNPILSLKEVNKAEQSFIVLQNRLLDLQECYYSPTKLLTEEENKILHEDERLTTSVLGQFAKMDKRNYDEWNRRIFALLEHLERRASDRRSVVYLNRTLAVSIAAISISLISLIVIIALHFI